VLHDERKEKQGIKEIYGKYPFFFAYNWEEFSRVVPVRASERLSIYLSIK